MAIASLLVSHLVGFIPSPSRRGIGVGPLQFRAYGLAIALGVLAAVAITQRRWAHKGGDPADIAAIATGSVIAGLVGARLYHVLTDYKRFEDHWFDVVKVWQGGLGIPGGLVLGVLVGVYLARKRGMNIPKGLDSVAPALPVAQAIGRLGNWFNQELFGRPTTLAWGLKIDPLYRPAGYESFATYHPTFAYEALWNLALAGLLVAWDNRRPNAQPGRLFACYVGGYGLGRLWVESLRIDEATHIFGVRVNIWTSLIAIAGAGLWLLLRGRRPADDPEPVPVVGEALA
jgi:prolipoprotein diacylglyceryl transferase